MAEWHGSSFVDFLRVGLVLCALDDLILNIVIGPGIFLGSGFRFPMHLAGDATLILTTIFVDALVVRRVWLSRSWSRAKCI